MTGLFFAQHIAKSYTVEVNHRNQPPKVGIASDFRPAGSVLSVHPVPLCNYSQHTYVTHLHHTMYYIWRCVIRALTISILGELTMNNNRLISPSTKKLLLVLMLPLAAWEIAFAAQESTVFTYDGQDFIRQQTTLKTADGQSAVNTKLDHKSPAYKELVNKRSYSGASTIFGHKCDANYAPLTNASGQLTGALFVAICDE